MRWVPNSAAGTACMDSRCVLPPLDMPGCFGRRNCNVNLDDLRWNRSELVCELQQARGIPAIFNWTRQLSCPVELCEVQTYLATDLAKSRLTVRLDCRL